MTPYRYFENKEHLFAAVRTEAFRRFADRQAVAAKRRGSARTRLGKLGQAYVEFALAEPDAYRIMFELEQPEKGEHPELDAEVERSFSYLLEATSELAREGTVRGDPFTLAHFAWAQVHGLVSLHLAGMLTIDRPIEALVEAAFELLTPKRSVALAQRDQSKRKR
jgi:AcrR family transcriptional regulator